MLFNKRNDNEQGQKFFDSSTTVLIDDGCEQIVLNV